MSPPVKLLLRPALLVETRCSSSARWWASMADAEERGDLAAMESLSEGITVFEGVAVYQ